jgi:Holliday junction DNA helicase RuvA
MKLDDLALKIATSEVKGLSKVKGLGKKTAERIILELREKITADVTATESAETQKEFVPDGNQEDAIIALMSLGFTKSECVAAVKSATENGATTIEQIIAYSIKNIK